MKHYHLLTASIMTCLIAACGGSGGSGNSAPEADVSITEDNAVQVTATVLESSFDDGDPLGADVLDDFLFDASFSGDSSTNDVLRKPSLQQPVAGTNSFSENCTVSGSMSITVNVSSDSGISAGDSISSSFSNCNNGDGTLVNGGLTMTFTSFSGDTNFTGDFAMGLRIDFNNLSTTYDGESSLIDGDMSMDVSVTSNLVSLTLSASRLDVGIDGIENSLSAYAVSYSLDNTTGDFSTTVDGTVTSGELGGTVSFDTLVPFTGGSSSENPDEGELIITGGSGSSVTVIILNSMDIELQIDADGDGEVDATRFTTWTELEAAVEESL